MKKILFVAGYVVSLCWRILKFIANMAWELYVEMPLMILLGMIIDVLEDYEKYKAKKNAIVEDTSDGMRPMNLAEFCRERYPGTSILDPMSPEQWAVLNIEWANYFISYNKDSK